jgi:TRAP-type transport system small permease protein
MWFLRAYHAVAGWIARATGAAAMVGLLALVAITGWQVYGRYVLRSTPVWVEGAALLLILYISFAVAALGVRERFHIGIVTLPEMLRPRARRALEGFTDLILLLFGVGMTWWSFDLVLRTWNRLMPVIGLPVGVKYLALVVCGVLIVLFTLERLLLLLAHWLGKEIGEDRPWA